MKIGPDALGTVENENGSAKHEKLDPTPSVSSESSPTAPKFKTTPGALGTDEI
jgi:hypothetical protein